MALRQLAAVQTTLQKLQGITTEQADREAVQDSSGSVAAAVDVLANWFGGHPAEFDDDLRGDD